MPKRFHGASSRQMVQPEGNHAFIEGRGGDQSGARGAKSLSVFNNSS